MTLPSPTPAERTAIKTAYAALRNSKSPTSYIVEQAVYALGAAQQLMDPETAEELRKLRARVAELESVFAAERARHIPYEDSPHCRLDGEFWPCPLVAAVDVVQPPGAPTAAELADEAVRRSVDAQFPVVAAFLAQDPPGYALTGKALPVCPTCRGHGCCCTCFGKTPQQDCTHQPAPKDVTRQVRKLRVLLAGQREQAGGES